MGYTFHTKCASVLATLMREIDALQVYEKRQLDFQEEVESYTHEKQ